MIFLLLSSIYATDISAAPNEINHAGAAQPLHYSSTAGTNNQDLTVRCPCSWPQIRSGIRIVSDLLLVGVGITLFAGVGQYPIGPYNVPNPCLGGADSLCSSFNGAATCGITVESDPTSTMRPAIALTATSLTLALIERVMGCCKPVAATTPAVGTGQPSYGTPQ